MPLGFSSLTSFSGPAPPALASESSQPIRVLRPRPTLTLAQLFEVWQRRELLGFLALRDIKVRYKQTLLGGLWAVIQPLVMMIVLSELFGKIIDPKQWTTDVPYPVFLYAGLLPWSFFAAAVTASSQSMVQNAVLLRKIYFPRLILPLAALGAPLVDWAVAFSILVVLMVWFHVTPTLNLFLLPLLVVLASVAALAVGVGLSGLTARYRDFRYVVPFFLQVGFFATPVIWPVGAASPRHRYWLALNPLAGVIEGFRAAVLGDPLDWNLLAISSTVALAALALALAYFMWTQRQVADVV